MQFYLPVLTCILVISQSVILLPLAPSLLCFLLVSFPVVWALSWGEQLDGEAWGKEEQWVKKEQEQNMINMSPKFSLQLNAIKAKYAFLWHFLFSQLLSRRWTENYSLSSKSKTNQKKANLNLFMQLPFQINLEFLSGNLCWADVCFLNDCIGLFLEVSAWKTGETEDCIKFYHSLANTWGNNR